ncbi:hypothetical protein [Thermosynechococcus sp. FA-CM-4201]
MKFSSDTETLTAKPTIFVKMAFLAVRWQEIVSPYGLRTWIEYSLKQAKDTLSSAGCRKIGDQHIEKWWELVDERAAHGQMSDAICPLVHQRSYQRIFSSV